MKQNNFTYFVTFFSLDYFTICQYPMSLLICELNKWMISYSQLLLTIKVNSVKNWSYLRIHLFSISWACLEQIDYNCDHQSSFASVVERMVLKPWKSGVFMVHCCRMDFHLSSEFSYTLYIVQLLISFLSKISKSYISCIRVYTNAFPWYMKRLSLVDIK